MLPQEKGFSDDFDGRSFSLALLNAIKMLYVEMK